VDDQPHEERRELADHGDRATGRQRRNERLRFVEPAASETSTVAPATAPVVEARQQSRPALPLVVRASAASRRR
jgi:hypothetical protein